jgi:hypothetical protein
MYHSDADRTAELQQLLRHLAVSRVACADTRREAQRVRGDKREQIVALRQQRAQLLLTLSQARKIGQFG